MCQRCRDMGQLKQKEQQVQGKDAFLHRESLASHATGPVSTACLQLPACIPWEAMVTIYDNTRRGTHREAQEEAHRDTGGTHGDT